MKPTVRYEDAAERITTTGWRCKTCRRFYGDEATSERCARWCCATDLPCGECGGRNPNKGYTCCEACRAKHADARWAALPRVSWDGDVPLCEWDGDRYFFSIEDLENHLDNCDGLKVEDLRLVLCKPFEVPGFSMGDRMHDYLGEDDTTDYAEIDRIIDEWIKAHVPQTWEPTGEAVSVKSLREWLAADYG